MIRRLFASAAAAGLLAATIAPASAEDPAAFYAGKTFTIYVGFSPGGGYDQYARAIGRHMGKHIPGQPAVLVKNLEGGGSLRAAKFIDEVAPRDGTVIATIGRGTPFAPLLEQTGATFDATKMTWIGSANEEVSVCAAWHTAPVSKLEDLYKTEIALAGTVASDDAVLLPRTLNGLFGTKFKTVLGYKGGTEMNLAMERGEADGRCGLSWSSFKSTYPHWLAEKKVVPLFQIARQKHPDLPHLPLVTELARNDEEKQILRMFIARQVMGRPFFGPPGIPADRTKAIREAFLRTLSDPAFRAEADKAQLEVEPVSGEEVEAIVKEIYATPRDVLRRAADVSK
jgi:tripartite-type tricarboxylate transporter receptor subunit TctC